jgi:thermitase
MELKFIHIFGPALVIIAFWMFGKGIVNRTRGKRFRPLPAFLFMLVAVVYHFIVPKSWLVEAYGFVHADSSPFDMLLDRVTIALMDFGIGMCIDAGYLAYKKHNSKLFWVPGVLALVISTAIYLFAALIDRIADEIRGTSEYTELLVELGPDDHISEVIPVLQKYQAEYTLAFPDVNPEIDATLDDAMQDPSERSPEDKNLGNYYVISVDPAFVEPLSRELRNDSENVDALEINDPVGLIEPVETDAQAQRRGPFLANDPQLPSQWFAEALAFNEAHQLLRNAKPKKKATVAIVDTGVEGDHEDLKDSFKKSKGDTDKHGHGTHCAGLAGAVTNNGKGVASLNWEGKYIDLKGYPALNRNGFGTDRSVAQAIIDAANGDADVISMSLGGPGKPSKAQSDAIRYAFKQGAIVVVAAGNSNRDAQYFSPASIPGVIVVSAVDQNLNKASFSNTNTSLKMPIAAPGVDIMSSVPGSQYRKFSGTSMATPLVSGMIGIMRSFEPNMTTEEAYELLKQTGSEVDDSYRIGKVIQPKAIIEKMTSK